MNGRRRALAWAALCAAGCALAPVQAGPPSPSGSRPSSASAEGGVAPSSALAAGLARWLGAPKLWGQADFRYFGFAVYQAQLWVGSAMVDPAQAWAQQPVVLSLRYQRALQGPSIAQRSIEEMRRHPLMPEGAAAAWLAQLQALLSDVREGERLIGVYHPSQGLQMWHEGAELRALGATQDTLLARVFMGIWLDPSTSAPELRQRLLGLNRP